MIETLLDDYNNWNNLNRCSGKLLLSIQRKRNMMLEKPCQIQKEKYDIFEIETLLIIFTIAYSQ